jgi:hypothetical protein
VNIVEMLDKGEIESIYETVDDDNNASYWLALAAIFGDEPWSLDKCVL